MMRLALAAAISTAFVAAGCTGSPSERIAMPAADATPAAVVRAYVTALNAHDDRGVQALSNTAESVAWLDDVREITSLRITSVSPENPRWSAQPAGTQVRCVHVRFDVDWGLFSDGSLDEGDTVWGYALKRNPVNGRWVIFDEGVA